MIKYLEKLLNGREVEWKKLRDVCEIIRGVRITKKELLEEGYPVVSGGIGYMGYTDKFNRDKNTITICQYGTAGYVNWQTEKFWANDICYTIISNDKILKRYLYFFLVNKQEYLYEISNRTAVPYSISKEKILDIDIPIPPLDIQEEIVRVLDKFTDHTKELTKELTLRKKEYSYYRDYLLEFKNIDDLGIEVKKVELLDVCLYSNEKIESSLLNLYNYISIENMLQNCKGVIPSSNVPDKGKWTKYAEGDILIGNIRPYLKKIWLADKEGGTNGDVLVLKKNSDKINMKYLYFVLSDDNFFNYVKNNIKSGKMPRGDKERILKYNFFLPTLEIQERIVNVLDNFEKICNDLNIGLPKEIELRQKEYEYYREYILTNIGNRITLEDKTI